MSSAPTTTAPTTSTTTSTSTSEGKTELKETKKAPAIAPINLKGRAAIVTGSTSGIGIDIARALASLGCNVLMCGSRERQEGDPVDQVAKEFPDVKILYCQASLTKLPEAAESIIKAAVDGFGRLDILVNNAGVQYVSPLTSFPTEEWDRLLAINLSAPFHLMRLGIPIMKKNERKWGRIINISSVHGVVASVNKSAYIASKHGLNGLTKTAALELAGDTNITVNSICPGWVHTPLVQKQIESLMKKDGISEDAARTKLLSEKQPKAQFTNPTDIGAYVAFLCSEAANNITGGSQIIDGAWTVP